MTVVSVDVGMFNFARVCWLWKVSLFSLWIFLACKTRNAPSAGTESIDRIRKCQSGLWDAIVFSSKTTCTSNHSSWCSQFLTLLCSAPVAVPGPRAPTRDIMRRVRYGIVPTFRRDSQNLRWNLPWHGTVYCTMRIECRRHSWRILRDNGGMGDVWRGVSWCR